MQREEFNYARDMIYSKSECCLYLHTQMGCSRSKVAKSTVKFNKELSPAIQLETDYPGSTNVQTADGTGDNCREAANRTLELSQDQISQYVKSALSQYLVGYETQYIPGLVNPNDINGIMEVARNRSISLSPDPTGEFLSYGLQPTRYVLYYNRKPPRSVKFLYQWDVGRETFITSPYIPSNAGDGISVPCAQGINLTCHLLKSDPVPGIIEALAQLSSVVSGVSHPNMGLVGPEFEWNFDGAFPIAFNVMSGTRSHWQEVDGNSGEVKFTNNNANVLTLRLVRTQ